MGQLLWSDAVSKLARRGDAGLQMFIDGAVVRPTADFHAFMLNLNDRIYHAENFQRLPGLNADIDITKNLDWEVLGTGASSDDVTFDAEGGITLETDASASQQEILCPHLDSGQSALTTWTWGSDQEIWFATAIKTAAAVADVHWAGWKLTNTSVVATDADQCFFRAASGENWKATYSIGGTDVEVDTGVALAVSTVYRLLIIVDADRIARFYINGALVATSTALTDAKDFIPYVGVQGNAKKHTVRYIALGRNAA